MESISLEEYAMVGGLEVLCYCEGMLPKRHRHSALASSSTSRAHSLSNRGKEGMVEGAGGGTLGAGSAL